MQVSIEDTPVTTMESGKVRALLIYLVVQDAPHWSEQSAGMLWPGCPKQVTRHIQRQALVYGVRGLAHDCLGCSRSP